MTVPNGSKRLLITDFFGASKKAKLEVSGSTNTGKAAIPTDNSDKGATEPQVQKTEALEEQSEPDSSKHDSSIHSTQTQDNSPSSDDDYADFCAQHNFNKEQWVASLTPEERELLQLEVTTIHITWLVFLHKELTKPYFLKLKRFLKSQSGKTVFPPPEHIYSWSHLTPLPNMKCLILGQDPYHNFNQAHGLAFLVLEPTRPPPSLLNIYKTLKIDFPTFEAPDYKKLVKIGKPGGGNLTKWAERGVLMLNACLTVEAHKANSHAKQGWEQFTEAVIRTAIGYANQLKLGFVIMAWGLPAQKRVSGFRGQLNSGAVPFLVLESVHPSPLSARRGFFELQVFKKCNEWLSQNGESPIDWGLLEGNTVTY